MMRSIRISRLLFRASFAIMAILSACPAADSGGDSKSGPVFEKLGIDDKDKKKIIAFFSKDISGTPDANKITVKKGSTTLKPATDYTLAIEKGRLVITLKAEPSSGVQYTVELQAGAVKDANGKANIANTASKDKTLTVVGIIVPSIEGGSLSFKANSKEVLTLSFNTDIEIVDENKINVEVKADGAEEFTAARATSAVNTANGKLLELTLATPAADDDVYRVRVGVGALRATESKLANKKELTSSEFTYSTSPILDTANRPYILHNKLVATFNFSIYLKDWTKVKVYKNPDGDNQEINLSQGNIAVNNANRRLLEITLPAVKADEVYRLRLKPGAVNEEGKGANVNKAIAPADIIIGAAPALHTETEPFLGRQKIIVTFDAPIRILGKTRIKYQLNSTLTTPRTDPTVVNNNQLEIPLNAPPTGLQVYRIDLADGALVGGKNTVSMGAIQPNDKDITVWLPVFTNVKPAFDSATQLSVTFLVDVAIVGDDSTINVQKKDEGNSFTTLTAASRDIAVDGMNSKKINITLTGGEKITPYTQVWKVHFPPNTVETATSEIPNAGPLTTARGVLRLTDLYSWKEVPTSGSSKWKARSLHTSVVFNSKIWVMGGYDGTDKFNDVWSSTDGSTWTRVNNAADWPARSGHTSVVFDPNENGKRIWVLGGRDDTKRLNDVWSSTDGSTWTRVNNAADWPARSGHTSVVFDPDENGKRIWVMGGRGNTLYADVWSSTDGSTWVKERAGTNMGWSARSGHASTVFKKRIWVIGGYSEIEGYSPSNTNSVWSSTNGKDWERDTDLPEIVGYSSTVKYNDRLWNFGTRGNDSRRYFSDAIIKSFFSNAISTTSEWTAENALMRSIYYTEAVVFKNRIWLLGGYYGGSNTNKVWNMGPASE